MLDRLEGESVNAYNLFLLYVQNGGSTRIVSELTGKTQKNISNYMLKFNWKKRYVALQEEQKDSIVTQLTEVPIDMLVRASNQNQVRTDSLEDYNRMIIRWRELLERVDTVYDFSAMVRAREVIDNMGRKAAMLPQSYKPAQEAEDDEDVIPDNKLLSWTINGITKTEEVEEE